MILEYKGTNIFYTDLGKGTVVVLLHGFLENSTMWNDFASEVSKTNRVISIDLLGHGNTGCLGYVHSMNDMADAVNAVLIFLQLRRVILIGHSMGGYVALAFTEKYIKKVKGLCLMNSTFEQDDKERKELRKRANKMAQSNYKNLVRMSYTNLFSQESRRRFKGEIELAIKEALRTPVQGYIAANEGMILRKNYKSLFTNGTFKKSIILGEKDWIIDSEKMISYSNKSNINYILLSRGHMSHIENKNELINALKEFIRS